MSHLYFVNWIWSILNIFQMFIWFWFTFNFGTWLESLIIPPKTLFINGIFKLLSFFKWKSVPGVWRPPITGAWPVAGVVIHGDVVVMVVMVVIILNYSQSDNIHHDQSLTHLMTLHVFVFWLLVTVVTLVSPPTSLPISPVCQNNLKLLEGFP